MTELPVWRRHRRQELLVLVVGMVLSLLVFRLTDLDRIAASWFYFPDHPDRVWPIAKAPFWHFFYEVAPLFTGLLACIGFSLLIWGSLKARQRHLRVYGVFLVGSVILGPGLVVNAIFKDHWGRPRPREIVDFGGQKEFLPLWEKGLSGGGKSFPCGHCSVGWIYGLSWFLFRRKRLRWAIVGLLLTVGFSTCFGIARMAAGAHFLSDVLWAGFFTLSVGWVLYYWVLRIPEREAGLMKTETWLSRKPRLVLGLTGGTILAVAAGLLLASPIYRDIRETVTLSPEVEVLDIRVSHGDVTLVFVPRVPESASVGVWGEVRGFGFPEFSADLSTGGQGQRMTIAFEHSGLFTEFSNQMRFTIPAEQLSQIEIVIDEGSLRWEGLSGLEAALPRVEAQVAGQPVVLP